MNLPGPKHRAPKPPEPKKEATNGINLPRSSKKGQKVSIERLINKHLVDHPEDAEKVVDVMFKAATGNLSEMQIRAISRGKGFDFAKLILERVDGPVAKRLDLSIKTDKTLVLHDGPAVDIGDLLDNAEDAEVKRIDE